MRPVDIDADACKPRRLGQHDARDQQRHGGRARALHRHVDGHDATRCDVDCYREPWAANRSPVLPVEHLDVRLRVVNLHDVQRRLGAEAAGGNQRSGIGSQSLCFGVLVLAPASCNGVASRHGQAGKPTPAPDLVPDVEQRVRELRLLGQPGAQYLMDHALDVGAQALVTAPRAWRLGVQGGDQRIGQELLAQPIDATPMNAKKLSGEHGLLTRQRSAGKRAKHPCDLELTLGEQAFFRHVHPAEKPC
jgi:hypothetical protein